MLLPGLKEVLVALTGGRVGGGSAGSLKSHRSLHIIFHEVEGICGRHLGATLKLSSRVITLIAR